MVAALALLPVYPSFGSAISGSSNGLAAWNPDESTIVDSYDGEEFDALASANAGFVSLEDFVDNGRDLRGAKSVRYTVRSGDALSTIAARNGISMDSLLWANGLTRSSTLRVGMQLTVPPVTGLVHAVAKGDTVASLAKKFSVSEDAIVRQNALSAGAQLAIGSELIIPDGKRPVEPKPVLAAKPKPAKKPAASRVALAARAAAPSAAQEIADGYTLEKVSNGKGFVWGNCTYFVAKYANVTWRGNAKDWLRNAAAAGVATGSSPRPGSIVVFKGAGYDPKYGHVGIVVETEGDDVIVKDMNFRRLNEVTTRRVSAEDPAIKGYIYAN